MNSVFNEANQIKFIQEELNKEFLQFPGEIEDAYSNVYKWLIQQTKNDRMEKFIRNANFNLDYYIANPKDKKENEDVNWRGAGYEFSRLVPGHTLKAYKLFLQIEKTKNNTALDMPILSIIDIGCGGGSVTIALLSLLIKYQKFKLENQSPITPIKLYCLGIDPNLVSLEIYTTFLRESSTFARSVLIDVEDMTIPGLLPEHISEITDWINEKQRLHNLIIGLGNVIRPITREHQRTNRFLGFLRTHINLPKNYASGIGYSEINAIKTLMGNSSIDRVVMAIVGSDSTNPEDKTNKSWEAEVKLFQKKIKTELKEHNVFAQKSFRDNGVFLGPADSFYRKFDIDQNPYPASYQIAYSLVNNNNYDLDQDWLNILDEKNLLLAWARVRNELSYFQLEDTIEIRLFETNIVERIQKLRQDILSYRWKSLNIDEMFNFLSPKGENKNPRPLNLCRLEEQILAVAIFQVKGEASFEFHPRSYAYKLSSKKQGEFLYENWYTAYSAYINDARKICEKHPDLTVIRTDIKSYYTRIKQDDLQEKIIHSLKAYDSRVADVIQLLLKREFDWEKNLGIPQGHAISGLISDIYLQPIDKKFGDKNSYDIEYFRYVDDIIIISSDNEKAQILNDIQNSLLELGLELSDAKTETLSTSEFLSQTEKDLVLDAVSDEHNSILRKLYKLDRKHYSFSWEDWWGFIEKYQKILSTLGVFIRIPRLSRKIKASQSWWNRSFLNWKSTQFPDIQKLEDLDDIDNWVNIFNEKNSEWINQKLLHQQTLRNFFQEGIDTLRISENQLEKAKAQRKIKFSVYRLGQLGFGDYAEKISNLLIESPWLVNIRMTTQSLALQNHEDLLLNIYFEAPNKPESEYVKSCTLKAILDLPKPSQKAIAILSKIVVSESSSLEKTIAAEVLLLSQSIDNPDLEDLQVPATLQDPYLTKNLLLLTRKFGIETEIPDFNFNNASILNDAFQFSRLNGSFDELYQYEADILQDYYYGSYPDTSEEFPEPPY